MKISDAQIAARVGTKAYYRRYRDKVHRLRRLVAGDVSALDDGIGGNGSSEDMERLYKADRTSLFDIMVTDIEAGRTNKLLQTVRTLALQTTLEFPAFEFEDLDSEENIVNTEWLKSRMKRADAQEEAFQCTMDYLVGGLGAAFVGYRDDYLCVDRIDPLDLTWDLHASTFGKVRWASWTVRQPLSEWLEMFPRNEDLKAMSRGGDSTMDTPVAVECYYDTEGESGNMAYFLCADADGDAISDGNLLERTKNPYREDVGGVLMPCVPVVFMHYFSLPSVKVPLSTVEMMLPAQIALWESDRRIRDVVAANRPVWQYDEGAINAQDLEAWKNGDTGLAMRKTKPGSQGLTVQPTIGIDQSLVEYRNRNEEELVGQGGANPYASGNPVKGVSYAAEVNAIQGQAGLVAASVGKDVARFWQGLGKKALAAGQQFDDQPFIVRTVDGNTQYTVEFGPATDLGPVNQYLRPDADLVVNEDTMSFKPKEAKIQLAAANLQLAAPFAQQFPNLLTKALEEVLRAQGVKDIASRLEPPQMPDMGLGMAPGMMEDPAAMAMASSAA